MRNLSLFLLCVAAGSLSLHRAAGQQPASETPAVAAAAPASLVARNPAVTTTRPVSPSANAAAQRPDTTKIVQIYGGAGYFDLALAEKLRPRLVKGFASTTSNSLPAPPGPLSVPAKADGPKKVTEASNL